MTFPPRLTASFTIAQSRALIAALVFFVLTMTYTPKLTHDGRYYAGAAQSLLDGEGMRYYAEAVPPKEHPLTPGDYFTLWSPGFPLLMAGGKLLGMDYQDTARLINALSMALIGFLVIITFGDVPLLVHIPALFLTFYAISTLDVLKIAFSDVSYLALWSLFLYMLLRHPERLFLITLVAAWLALLRYVGLSAIIIGSLCYLLLWGEGWFKRLLNSGIFFLGSFVPIGCWLLRNLGHGKPLMGERVIGSHSWGDVLSTYLQIHWDVFRLGVVAVVGSWGVFYLLSGLYARYRDNAAVRVNRRTDLR